MPKIAYGLVFILLGAMPLAACGETASAPTPAPTSTPTVTPTPMPSPTPSPVPSPTPSPTATSAPPSAPGAVTGDLSPRQIMEMALEAMADVESFHFELESEISASSEGADAALPISFVGDFQAPDRLRGKLSLSLGFFSIDMESITIGDTTYINNPESGQWEISSDFEFGVPDPTELASPGEIGLDGLTLVGEESLDGDRVYRLRGAAPEGLLGEGQDETEADFFIGVDDLRIRRVMVEGEVPLGDSGDLGVPFGGVDLSGTAKITLSITFSAYNEPVVIEAPQVP